MIFPVQNHRTKLMILLQYYLIPHTHTQLSATVLNALGMAHATRQTPPTNLCVYVTPTTGEYGVNWITRTYVIIQPSTSAGAMELAYTQIQLQMDTRVYVMRVGIYLIGVVIPTVKIYASLTQIHVIPLPPVFPCLITLTAVNAHQVRSVM